MRISAYETHKRALNKQDKKITRVSPKPGTVGPLQIAAGSTVGGRVRIHDAAGPMVAWPSPHESGIMATTRSITPLWQSVVHIYSTYIAIVEEQLFDNPILSRSSINLY